jgi:hypothetical protein
MSPDDILWRLEGLGRRLRALSDQARQTWRQARDTLDRVEEARDEVAILGQEALDTCDTVVLRTPLSREPAT